MGWFKMAKDFGDRNLVNHKIIYLTALRDNLEKISKVVFQSGTTAKGINFKLLTSKKITSYPALRNILIEADSKALDSPWKFADLCNSAIDIINTTIFDLKEERKRLTFNKDKPKKGWY
jgi:hypothetical protein